MIHLRIIAPRDRAQRVLELLERADAVSSVVHLPGAARRPPGDVVLCDVAREDASVIVSDLRDLRIDVDGSIALEEVDTEISRGGERAVKAAEGAPSDAVVWEQVTARTSETAELSGSFLAFMALAMLIAASGIILNTTILIIGAMIVGPDFGPVAGFCVAAVQGRGRLAARSLATLVVGFAFGVLATYVVVQVLRAGSVVPDTLPESVRSLGPQLIQVVGSPGFFSFFVAFCAGVAGMLSLSTAKSGALIGVLVSVTTIPAAANVGLTAAYGNWSAAAASLEQLGVNVGTLLAAGTFTLVIQRLAYRRRRRAYLGAPRRSAGMGPRSRSEDHHETPVEPHA